MTPGPGALLGERYELVALLGRGGMADVYRAEDRLLRRPVAVKVLRESADSAADRARFAAEARVLAGLAHPNLVLLLDAGTEGDHPYLVLELVEGRTWGDLLGRDAASPTEVARLAVQVAAALAAAHAAGVVHRDVKPANVLVDATGRARLADFGIARLVDENVRHTRTGFTVGTAAYLAPEQVRGDAVTTAADVYALGLVLLEAVTGERAYPGTSTESAFARLQRSPAIPVSLPRGWPRLLAAMTATDPAERPTAGQVADRLAELADPGRPALVVPEDATMAVPLAPTRRRVPWPLLGAAAALVLVLGVASMTGAPGTGDAPAAAEEVAVTSDASAESAITPVAAAPDPTAQPKSKQQPAVTPVATGPTQHAKAKQSAAKKHQSAKKHQAAKKRPTAKKRHGRPHAPGKEHAKGHAKGHAQGHAKGKRHR